MKKLLLLIGITATLGFVNIGTRANDSPTSDAPQDLCSEEDQLACNNNCKLAGCNIGVCFPPCECFNRDGTRCTK